MSGSAPYLKRDKKGVWYVHWTHNRIGKRVSTRSAHLPRAKEFLAAWLTVDQQNTDPGVDLTLAEVWLEYLAKHVRVKLANDKTACDVWKNLEPHFGQLPASALTQNEADTYTSRRTSGKLGRRVQPQTVRKELAYIAAAVKFCADPRRKIIPPEFAHKLTLPEPGEARDRWLRTEEIQKLLDAAARLRDGTRLSRGERFLWLALETAAREQAILDLTWDRVDFETNTIRYDVPGRRKTKKRRATVPISKALLPILKRAHGERTGDGKVLDNGSGVWLAIQKIVVEAGLGEDRKSKRGRPMATGISPHVFRHTAATHMVRRGVPLYIVAAILGNSVKMIAEVYGHHAKEDLQAAVDMISGDKLEAAE